VNTGNGDGKIFPGNIGGVECYQLVRKPDRPEAYLYLRIAPEVKDPPVTKAMVVVEYFDAVPGDARSLLTFSTTPQRGLPASGSACATDRK